MRCTPFRINIDVWHICKDIFAIMCFPKTWLKLGHFPLYCNTIILNVAMKTGCKWEVVTQQMTVKDRFHCNVYGIAVQRQKYCNILRAHILVVGYCMWSGTYQPFCCDLFSFARGRRLPGPRRRCPVFFCPCTPTRSLLKGMWLNTEHTLP